MAHCRWYTVATAVLSAFALAASPLGEQDASAAIRAAAPPMAKADWIDENLASAKRSAATLDGRGIGSARAKRAAPRASPRHPGPKAVPSLATFPPHTLDQPAETVEIAIDTMNGAGGFLPEMRGLRPDGTWSEWHSAVEETDGSTWHARLPIAVERVQTRVAIEPYVAKGARLTGARLRPAGKHDGAVRERSLPAEAFSARVFATRIGLVGSVTANGHTIRPNDHFVALPSRRVLAQRDTGDYTVRVCTEDTSRCVYAPVWDVGPWNTTDDYWNESRQGWPDLERGLPQAQAAFQNGYNDGTDGRGRTVGNPAGIDLADGTFTQGLQLDDNAWVRTDFLWTKKYAHPAEITTVNENEPVTIRSAPATSAPPAGLATEPAHVDVTCQTQGDPVSGPLDTLRTWYRIGPKNYIPATFAEGGVSAPLCE